MDALLVALLVFLAVQRVGELLLARRNVRALEARGARAVPADLYAPIVALHVAFFLALALEGAFSPFAARGAWTWPLLGVFAIGQALRYAAIATLGERWTTRLYVVPGAAPVAHGPYRFVRHPNYVGVALELAALPLAFGCVATAVVFSLLNGILLARRVAVEERALAEAAGAPEAAAR